MSDNDKNLSAVDLARLQYDSIPASDTKARNQAMVALRRAEIRSDATNGTTYTSYGNPDPSLFWSVFNTLLTLLCVAFALFCLYVWWGWTGVIVAVVVVVALVLIILLWAGLL